MLRYVSSTGKTDHTKKAEKKVIQSDFLVLCSDPEGGNILMEVQ